MLLSISALNSNGNHIKKYLAFLKILELPSEVKVEFSILSCQVGIHALIQSHALSEATGDFQGVADTVCLPPFYYGYFY